ncbi:unnamed protein product [Clonostachys solani]|uniref:Major facilitator superfamily (MFS) profile domain-containing protein n=1 Tax=Clonostachys solani TaxID=160281 RepID=A0A9N9YYS0_9HYPO|nr:unnamed protein product [Clonostachys solani]
MGITTTIEAPPQATEVINVSFQSKDSCPVSRQGDGGLGTEPSEPAARLFTIEPVSSGDSHPRLVITTLLVTLNMIQAVKFLYNFITIVGGLTLSVDLGRETGVGQANWMAASYSLTQGAFVLVTGRLGSIYGHQNLVLAGCAVFSVFVLANAFCRDYISFVAIRALAGVGGGMFMPNAVAIMTTVIPPGRSRNLALGFFSAAPPIGGVIGALLAGLFIEIVGWKWLFILIAGCSVVVTAFLAWVFPREQPIDRNGKIDFVGACLGLFGLLLFNVVWNQAPSVGWDTPYEIACLILSVLSFAAFIVWEKSFAKDPIMPVQVFRAPTFTALIFVVLLTYMGFSITLWYSRYIHPILKTGIHFIPFGGGAVIAVALAAWLISRVAAQWILAIGIGTVIVSNLLLATMPIQQTYWAGIFPAVLLSSFCPDLAYVAAQLIASNSVGRRHQGVAGSLIGTLNLYGNSLGLGFAGTIEAQVSNGLEIGDIVLGYRAALYFGMALGVVALILNFAFVRMPKDQRQGWDESLESDLPENTSALASAVDRRMISSVG